MQYGQIQLIFAILAGSLSAYLAHKSGKNPFKWLLIGALLGFFGILPIFFLSMKKKQTKSSRKPSPQVKFYFIDGPSHKFWYYLDATQNQLGPMSHNALTNAWREGKVNPTTYVWHEDLPDWKPLQDFIKVQS